MRAGNSRSGMSRRGLVPSVGERWRGRPGDRDLLEGRTWRWFSVALKRGRRILHLDGDADLEISEIYESACEHKDVV